MEFALQCDASRNGRVLFTAAIDGPGHKRSSGTPSPTAILLLPVVWLRRERLNGDRLALTKALKRSTESDICARARCDRHIPQRVGNVRSHQRFIVVVVSCIHAQHQKFAAGQFGAIAMVEVIRVRYITSNERFFA